ncbi:Uncharacterised protein [Vibrio cholerae]|nr:Uncharacterised protein [Vibrio cholerae]
MRAGRSSNQMASLCGQNLELEASCNLDRPRTRHSRLSSYLPAYCHQP